MPLLLAKLGEVVQPGKRKITVRRATTICEVSPAVEAMPESVVFLEGTGPPWVSAQRCTGLSPWPADLPPIKALWRSPVPKIINKIESILESISSQRYFTTDNRNVPLQLLKCKDSVAYVLNYSGWNVKDFPDDPVEVQVVSSPVGDVWIITPQAVLRPREDTSRVSARGARSAGIGGTQSMPASPVVEQAIRPQPPVPAPPVMERTFCQQFAWSQITFGRGRISFVIQGNLLTWDTPHAELRFQEKRDVLQEVIPEGITVSGVSRGGTLTIHQVEGLERLSLRLNVVEARIFVREHADKQAWIDTHQLQSGGMGRPPLHLDELLDIPELGLGKRREAFRRLWSIRDPAQRLHLLPGKAVIVIVPAKDGGPAWYVWETVLENHATYLFRPDAPVVSDAILAWTQKPNTNLSELLQGKALQAQLCYVGRVIHDKDEHDPIGRWWDRLRQRLQRGR